MLKLITESETIETLSCDVVDVQQIESAWARGRRIALSPEYKKARAAREKALYDKAKARLLARLAGQ